MKIFVWDLIDAFLNSIEDDEVDDFLRDNLNDAQMQELYDHAEKNKTYVKMIENGYSYISIIFADGSTIEMKKKEIHK